MFALKADKLFFRSNKIVGLELLILVLSLSKISLKLSTN